MAWLEILQGVSIIIASWAVIRGVNAWRSEFIGRRRIELAEETLTLFYTVKDAIDFIRSLYGLGGEGQTREPRENETPEEKRILDSAFVTWERYQKKIEPFNKLHALRYRFMTQFGEDEAQPFEEIRKIINEIIVASHLVGEYSIELLQGRVSLESGKEDSIKRQRRIIRWDRKEDDPTLLRVNAAIKDIEKVCKPVINKPSLFCERIKNW